MDFDWPMALGSFLVAIVVGLTGMGGGALMTPMLVTFFGVSPLAAVSSDLAASAVMKPVGSAVHYREGTVDMRLVGWLCLGSVPAAFCGVLIPRALGDGEAVHDFIKLAMGIALLVAATGILVRAVLSRRARPSGEEDGRITVRPVPTVLVGAVGGLVVGITSVGSGSLIIVALLLLYPALKPNHLVGTDLLQAVPLVLAAALGHFFFGDFQLEVTAALLVGSIPGVYLGSKISSRAPAGLIRRLLVIVLVASALNMFGVGVVPLAWTIAAIAAAAAVTWLVGRRKRDTVPAELPDEAGESGKRSARGRSMAAPDR
ncbi:sulfite exporter TauE/SafE family protein [Actinomadura sp. WMMB 499]|uniref:sulfite exporter TauE/SafE family protein n=1 Tax=Actinomadura sp. WMMB 499 TaxID=1219491 RepID=UPI001246856E|nr:sulfite exporter TauE/SafE family protein [Actinomadura sp. WMMB 499]QFG24738.1 sulfite exporter TauE/SafE family protein [Actinomadura sp. WMMB 499]